MRSKGSPIEKQMAEGLGHMIRTIMGFCVLFSGQVPRSMICIKNGLNFSLNFGSIPERPSRRVR